MTVKPIMAVTPVQIIDCPEAGDNRILVKREDLLPYSFGGNKVRIGCALMEDMHRRGFDAMIMYGDLRSNLCRVLSSLSAAEGVRSVMIATKENETEGPEPFNALLIRANGTEIFPCEKGNIAEAVDAVSEKLAGEGHRPYYIYGNRFGTGNEAACARAYIPVFGEIMRQTAAAEIMPDRIFVPCGTGSTMGGLVAGKLLAADGICPEGGGLPKGAEAVPIVGISISSRTPERASGVLERVIRAGCADAAERIRAGRNERHALPDTRRIRGACELLTEYSGGGYGAVSMRERQLSAEIFRRTSLPLDPTYTGKAFAGMLGYLRDRGIHGETCLFLHTGGLPLFFDGLRGGNCGQALRGASSSGVQIAADMVKSET